MKVHKLNQLPQINYGQSRFITHPHYNFTGNVGQLIPFMCEEMYPGDQFDISGDKQIRALTLIDPIFDDLICDYFYFFCPNRLIWENFTAFLGENKVGVYDDMPTYSVPQITAPENGWQVGTIADYIDMPVGVSNVKVSALPFRAIALTINQWFISQNLDNPCNIDFGNDDIVGSNGSNYVEDVVKGGMPFTANKLPDRFTRCLPSPQKGDPVLLPLGSSAPLFVKGDAYDQRFTPDGFNNTALKFANNNSATTGLSAIGIDNTTKVDLENNLNSKITTANYASIAGSSNSAIYGTNQYADLSMATAANINDLRLAFQMQKYLEKDSRYGTRYVEFLHSHFGVVSSDKTLQRVEYLNGGRFQLQINQVLQTTPTENGALGSTGAYSNTIFSSDDLHHSFEEHGWLLGFCVVRYKHSYCQGIPKKYLRKNKLDFYDYLFAHIGEQAILNKEIYAQGNDTDDDVFGYMEAWSEMRELESRSRGYLRPNVPNGISSWNLTDDYDSLPLLSSAWLKEDTNLFNRVIAVDTTNSHQLIFNFWLDVVMTRTLPMYSVPGLIDHF